MSEEVELIVEVCFWGAFIIDIFIVLFAIRLSKQMGGSGLLHKTTIYAGSSALVYGVHHVLELLLKDIPGGGAFAEGIEGIATILLFIAVYQLYKIVKGD